MKPLKVVIYKASDFDYCKYKEFKDANALFKYMMRTYGAWIIRTKKDFIGAIASYARDVDLVLTIYDDFVE